MNWNMKS